MPTFRYAKLVRDNIPGWHRAHGHTVVGRRLVADELVNQLVQKLHEESDEVSGALTDDDFLEELGDVQQIIWDVCATKNISLEDLKASIDKKTRRKGSYTGGEYIETLSIPDEDDKWAQYCRRSPEKYPEVK